MTKDYQPLKDHIRLVDARNKELQSTNLLGISIDKYFMPSVANIIGTDLSTYKLVQKDQFACNPMHVGRDDRMPIALYDNENAAIVSPAYFTFEITDTTKLLPKYAMLWFMRPEFDRECWFYTDSSVRGGITWDAICEMKLPVPTIEKQKAVIEAYEIIERRIELKRKINDNLESQALTVFRALTEQVGRNSTLASVANIVMGQSPSGESYNESGDGIVFYQGRADFGSRFPTCRMYTTEPTRFAKEGDILMSVRAPVGDLNIASEKCCIGRGLAAVRHKQGFQSFMYYTMLELKTELAAFKDDGTVFGSINKDDMLNLAVSLPEIAALQNFESKIVPLDTFIRNNEREFVALRNQQSLLLSELSSHR